MQTCFNVSSFLAHAFWPQKVSAWHIFVQASWYALRRCCLSSSSYLSYLRYELLSFSAELHIPVSSRPAAVHCAPGCKGAPSWPSLWDRQPIVPGLGCGTGGTGTPDQGNNTTLVTFSLSVYHKACPLNILNVLSYACPDSVLLFIPQLLLIFTFYKCDFWWCIKVGCKG